MNRAAVLAVDGGNSKTDVALVNSGGSVLAGTGTLGTAGGVGKRNDIDPLT